MEDNQKVTTRHLSRNAYLYVRQSTLRQVLENTESTQRQYALKERALALGWPSERIVVIDTDLGQSGANAADREGFQSLVTQVGMGRAGIVLGLEVSRLARNCADWHRLLEICALTDTLILDEDGVYDPSYFNDRLLLGLKGTMSEAELYVLRSRLRGGILNKARRGELHSRLPVGFAYDSLGRVVLDPDIQVQRCVQLLFSTFAATGSAWSTVKTFRQQGLAFPRHMGRGLGGGEIVWRPLNHGLVLHVLHNPQYAGAFAYGRTHRRKMPNGTVAFQYVPRDKWVALIKDAHPGYITWDQYESNLQRLSECRQPRGSERTKSPPREGVALLQGIVICGRCGERMTIRYHLRRGQTVPCYVCSTETVKQGLPVCQSIPGTNIDKAIEKLVLEAVTPLTLETALAVQDELQSRIAQADRLRLQTVERHKYEAELAQRRFMRVDPDNRLVAASLEADWNQKLRAFRDAEQQYERYQRSDRALLTDSQRRSILQLATDLPRVWHDPSTPARERKRLVRLIVEDVTLIKAEEVTAHVRFKSGSTDSIMIQRQRSAAELRKTSPDVVKAIDSLLDQHTEGEIASILNERGMWSGEGKRFSKITVRWIRNAYNLKTRRARLRERGLLTKSEMAKKLNIGLTTLMTWKRAGLLNAVPYNDKNECLYEELGTAAPKKYERKISGRVPAPCPTSTARNA